MTEHYTHEDGRAVLALPDMDGGGTGAATPATEAAARPALSLADLKAALAGLTAEERAALIGGA